MNERTMVYLDDVVEVIYQALRTPLPDYHKDPFHDSMGVAMAMANEIPSAQPEVKPISYTDCANAMLMMWMNEVLTDGEYNRIMDKLNAHEMKKREENV